MTQLTELWLHGNQFQSVDVLTNLSELRTIELSGNQITHPGVLIALTKLDSLYLTGNPIEPGPELEALFRTHVAPRWDSEAGFTASLTWVLKGNGIRVESSE
ncbi:MAG TPA: leucine-rich repeat domain-containing protein, partial [Candidatus Sulfotelmatobacter sp.]|nr:leucine-rich repeat domain-containing protein [Candidatus Sulfotelmatobacter sp.]